MTMKKTALILLALLLVLSCSAASAESAGDGFITPEVIPAGSIEDFAGEWFMYRIQPSEEDAMTFDQETLIAIGLVDNEPNLFITEAAWKSRTSGVYTNGTVEFLPESGTMKMIYETGDETVYFLNDNGMISCLSYSVGKEATIYFVRAETAQETCE